MAELPIPGLRRIPSEHTVNPGGNDLEGVDQLRIEARGQFDSHASREQHEVQVSQVRFLVPGNLILLDHASEDRVDLGLLVAVNDTHCERCHGAGNFVELQRGQRSWGIKHQGERDDRGEKHLLVLKAYKDASCLLRS